MWDECMCGGSRRVCDELEMTANDAGSPFLVIEGRESSRNPTLQNREGWGTGSFSSCPLTILLPAGETSSKPEVLYDQSSVPLYFLADNGVTRPIWWVGSGSVYEPTTGGFRHWLSEIISCTITRPSWHRFIVLERLRKNCFRRGQCALSG